MEYWQARAIEWWAATQAQLTSSETYLQAALAAAAIAVGGVLGRFLSSAIRNLEARTAPQAFEDLINLLSGVRKLAIPALVVAALSVALAISGDVVGESWLVRAVLGLSLIVLIYGFVSLFARGSAFLTVLKWIGVIIALLNIFGWLDDVVGYLEGVSLDAGNVHLTLYTLVRTALFGAALFWLGRLSTDTGQRIIRERTDLDAGARELIAKLFQMAIYTLILLVLLNVMGLDLTALAVFGGAVGIGLGLGLQQIASNFVAGIIILLDRSITIGDYIELEDGRAGTVRAMNVRSTTLATFDGKDIVTPNDRFITSSFVNWTHNDRKQRYDLRFQVAYSTDLEALFPVIVDTVASHPQVLAGDTATEAEQPDVEIEAFGESGIDLLVEFWMEGIDDGDNRVSADLRLMIWTTLKAMGVEMPFPQREVRVLGAG